MEKRLIELEKKAAFQDQAIAEIQTVLQEQYRRIQQLERELRQLSDKVTNQDLVRDQRDEEPPPHY